MIGRKHRANLGFGQEKVKRACFFIRRYLLLVTITAESVSASDSGHTSQIPGPWHGKHNKVLTGTLASSRAKS